MSKKQRARLIIAKLDRLARNVAFICVLMEWKVDFVNPHTTKFNIHILAAVAESERDAISKRTKEALAAARARGVKLGNYPRIARAKQAAAAARAGNASGDRITGDMSANAAARQIFRLQSLHEPQEGA